MSANSTAVIGLKDETLDKLRQLRRLNVDSAKGYEECCKLIDDERYQSAFRHIAHSRRDQAQALATQIEWNEGAEKEEGSYVAALHRTWLRVRETLTSDSVQAVLEEAERGEDVIKEAYEDALDACTGSPIHDLLAEQFAIVKETHDKVRGLRDARKDCAC